MAFCDIIFLLILNCQEKGLSFYILYFTDERQSFFYSNSMEMYISEDVSNC